MSFLFFMLQSWFSNLDLIFNNLFLCHIQVSYFFNIVGKSWSGGRNGVWRGIGRRRSQYINSFIFVFFSLDVEFSFWSIFIFYECLLYHAEIVVICWQKGKGTQGLIEIRSPKGTNIRLGLLWHALATHVCEH